MDIESLRAEVENAGPRAPGRRFSSELRCRLVRATKRLWRDGAALSDIADALGISSATAGRYLDEEESDDGFVPTDSEMAEDTTLPPAALVPVAIAGSSFTSSTIRVTTPGGYVVEGLDVDRAVELIRALS